MATNKPINFIVPAPPEYLSLYQKVIYSIIDPIRKHLPQSIVSPNSIPEAVNVHFFNEPSYFKRIVESQKGIHVFMSHGMGDKNWRNGPKVKRFDYICVSGPLWVEKMIRQNIPPSKILMVGYPKLDPLFQGDIVKADHEKKTIVYAPTHLGSAPCTSYPAFKEYLDRFPKEFETVCCVHPYHKKENKPILQEFACADAIVADGSSVIYEALALGIGVIFPDWLVKDAILSHWPGSFTAQIYEEEIGYHAKNFEHLIQLTEQAIANKLSPKDQAFIDGILPPYLRGKSGAAAAEALEKLAQ
jgi:CDP-glycerol glycerophosphotransferase (TagB/SpsB family)